VQPVSSNGLRAGNADGTTLDNQQSRRQRHRQHHHQHTNVGMGNHLRLDDALRRMPQQKTRRNENEQGLHQRSNRLGLAMTKTVLLIGRLQGIENGQQIDQ